jgi:hypothetical protein
VRHSGAATPRGLCWSIKARALQFAIFYLNLIYLQAGSILHDDMSLVSVALLELSAVTAVILASGSRCCPAQQRATAPLRPSPAVCVAPTASRATDFGGKNANAASRALGAAGTAHSSPPSSPATVNLMRADTPPQPSPLSHPATIQEGARVRIEGLQAKPHLNGLAGVVCGAFNRESGRWTVEVGAHGANPAFLGSFRPANLLCLEPAAPTETAATAASLKMPLPIKITQHGRNTTLHSKREGKDFTIEMPTRVFRQLEPLLASKCARNPGIKDEISQFYGVENACESRDALQEGTRVRVEDHREQPELNGMKCCVTQVDVAGGGVRVRMDPHAAQSALDVIVPRAKLKVIPKHNLSTEWVDENGVVCPKNVNFACQCPKGHALGSACSSARRLCRMCHCYSSGCDEACRWLVCSVVEGCCGGYAVCDKCSAASPATHSASTQWDKFCFSV